MFDDDVLFCYKLAKGDTFENCQLITPQGKKLNAKENGEVVDSETNEVFEGAKARPFKGILIFVFGQFCF